MTPTASAKRFPGIQAAALTLALLGTACSGPAPPRLLLLITVDTLRADHLGAYGSERGLTPRLDELARRSQVFSAAYAAAPFTLPSISALLTGRYPEELGMRSNESGLPAWADTLADSLGERGWRTSAVVSNFVLRASSGLGARFDAYDDDFVGVEAVRGWPERVAGETTAAALRALDACIVDAARPCFLWVHYQDPHGPYDPPEGARAAYLESERRAPGGTRLLAIGDDHRGHGAIPDYQAMHGRREVAFYRAGYDAEIHYMDEQVGRLLDALDERGLTERTVVVFSADHGESLGENDTWFAHGERLTDPLVHVPLLVRVPGASPGRRDDAVSLIDLRPTLLALVGRRAGTRAPGPDDPRGALPSDGNPSGGLRGRDLLEAGAAGRSSVPYMAALGSSEARRYGLVKDGYKFVVTERDGVWNGRLSRMGREDVDLSAAAPQIARELRLRLVEMRSEVDRGVPESRQELSAEDIETLRALGYGEPAE